MPAILRALHPRNPDEHHRVSTTLELFFDLVSVISIAAITVGLHHAIAEGHGLEALPRFAFLFLAIWWAWMNLTWFNSAFDNDDTLSRVLVMVIMGGSLMFAGGASHIFETLDFSFGLLGWCIMRLAMVALWLRAASGQPEYRGTALRYALGITVAQIAWISLYFLTEPGSVAFFAMGILCFAIEFATPAWAERLKATPFHRHHMIERYGLLMIITLGEVVLSISQGFGSLFGEHPTAQAALVSASSLVIVFCLWWVYFCEEDQLPSTRRHVVFSWGYGHFFVFIAAAMLGASVAALIDVATHHGHTTESAVDMWLGGSLALWSAALWFTRDRQMDLSLRQKTALPALALAFLVVGLVAAPIWVFALVSIAGVIWRAPDAAGHH